MGWIADDGSTTEGLPVDSRFIDKVNRGVVTKAEQTNSKFIKKWKSAEDYKNSVGLSSDERQVYNYLLSLGSDAQNIDPSTIESDLSTISPNFANNASNYYVNPLSTMKGAKLSQVGDSSSDSYVGAILANLQQKGLVKYA